MGAKGCRTVERAVVTFILENRISSSSLWPSLWVEVELRLQAGAESELRFFITVLIFHEPLGCEGFFPVPIPPLALGFSSHLVFHKVRLMLWPLCQKWTPLTCYRTLVSRWWLQEGCFLLFSFSVGFTQSCVLGSLRQIFLSDPALPLVVGNLMVWVQRTFQPLPQWLSST